MSKKEVLKLQIYQVDLENLVSYKSPGHWDSLTWWVQDVTLGISFDLLLLVTWCFGELGQELTHACVLSPSCSPSISLRYYISNFQEKKRLLASADIHVGNSSVIKSIQMLGLVITTGFGGVCFYLDVVCSTKACVLEACSPVQGHWVGGLLKGWSTEVTAEK